MRHKLSFSKFNGAIPLYRPYITMPLPVILLMLDMDWHQTLVGSSSADSQ